MITRWPASHPYIQILGRHSVTTVGEVQFDWPATRINLHCCAEKLTVLLSGLGVYFDIVVDGVRQFIDTNEPETEHCPGAFIQGCRPIELTLPAGKNVVVSLLQRSELVQSAVTLHGVELLNGRMLPLSSLFGAKIEFIGDSFFVGYGNLPGCQRRFPCSVAEIAHLTNSQLSMAAVCGNQLGAYWRITAMSGHGMVRNYDGSTDRMPLPDYLVFSTHSETTICRSAQFEPDVVVINLGTNDFSVPVKESEAFGTTQSLVNTFCHQYRCVISQFQQVYPQVKILLVGIPAKNNHQQWLLLQHLCAALQQENRVWFCSLPVPSTGGCDHHPDLAYHQSAGELMAKHIARMLQLKLS